MIDKKISNFSNSGLEDGLLIVNKNNITNKVTAANLTGIYIDDIIDTVIGATDVIQNDRAYYYISNYDITKQYDLKMMEGLVTRIDDQITYDAPYRTGLDGFILNNRYFYLNIIKPPVTKPVILIPFNKVNNVRSTVIFKISDYSSLYELRGEIKDSGFSLIGTDWELATDIDFNNLVAHEYDSQSYVNSWQVDSLIENTTYFVRARYKNSLYAYSEWSDTVEFKTIDNFNNITETAVITSTPINTYDYFGFSLSMSKDGLRIIVGAPYTDTNGYSNNGTAYIFYNNNGTWIQEAVLEPLSKDFNDYFGWSVDISDDGSKAVISAPNKNYNGYDVVGLVYYFIRVGTTWSQQYIINENNYEAYESFGTSVSLSGDGSRLAISAIKKNINGVTQAGQVYIYNRNINNWVEEKVINSDNIQEYGNFGNSIDLDYNGNTLVIGSQNETLNNDILFAGCVYIYSRVTILGQTDWKKVIKLISQINGDSNFLDNGNNYFGHSVSINEAGNRLAITSPGSRAIYVFNKFINDWQQTDILAINLCSNISNFTNAIKISADGNKIVCGITCYTTAFINSGAAYVFTYNNGWSQTRFLMPFTKYNNSNFGKSVTLNENGSVIMVGDSYAKPSNLTSAGSVFIFS